MIELALGIDIAKLKFNVCLINPQSKLKHKLFPNTSAGFEQLKAVACKARRRAPSRLPGSDWHIWRSSLPLSS